MNIAMAQFFPWVNPLFLGLFTVSMILYPVTFLVISSFVALYYLCAFLFASILGYAISFIIMGFGSIRTFFYNRYCGTLTSSDHANVSPIDNGLGTDITPTKSSHSNPWLALISSILGVLQCIVLKHQHPDVFSDISFSFFDPGFQLFIVGYLVICAVISMLVCKVLSSMFLRLFSKQEIISPKWLGCCFMVISLLFHFHFIYFGQKAIDIEAILSAEAYKEILDQRTLNQAVAFGLVLLTLHAAFVQLGVIWGINLLMCLVFCDSSTPSKFSEETTTLFNRNNNQTSLPSQDKPPHRYHGDVSKSRIKFAEEVAHKIISLKFISDHRFKPRPPSSSSSSLRRNKRTSINGKKSSIICRQLGEDSKSFIFVPLSTPTFVEPSPNLSLSADNITKEKEIIEGMDIKNNDEEIKEESILDQDQTIPPLITSISTPSSGQSTPNHVSISITTEDFYNELAAIALPPIPSISLVDDNNSDTTDNLSFNKAVHTSFTNEDVANAEGLCESSDQNFTENHLDELPDEKAVLMIDDLNNHSSNTTIIDHSVEKKHNVLFHEDQHSNSTPPQSNNDTDSNNDLMESDLYVKVGIPLTDSNMIDFDMLTSYTRPFHLNR